MEATGGEEETEDQDKEKGEESSLRSKRRRKKQQGSPSNLGEETQTQRRGELGKVKEEIKNDEEKAGMKRTERQEATRVTFKPWIWFERKLSHHHECTLLPRS